MSNINFEDKFNELDKEIKNIQKKISIDTIVKVSIVSDGLDNSSEEYSPERLRSNIRDLCEKGWEFCLVTNKENTKRAASEIGINQVYSYSCDDKEAKGVISFLSQFLFSLKKVTNKSL